MFPSAWENSQGARNGSLVYMVNTNGYAMAVSLEKGARLIYAIPQRTLRINLFQLVYWFCRGLEGGGDEGGVGT